MFVFYEFCFFIIFLLASFSLDANPTRAILSGAANCVRRVIAQRPPSHNEDMVQAFKNLMTQGYNPEDSSGRLVVMNQRWISNEWLKPTPPSSKIIIPSTTIDHFHQFFAERISSRNLAKFPSTEENLGRTIIRPGESIRRLSHFSEETVKKHEAQITAAVGTNMGKAFMDGQSLHLKGFAQSPRVFVTFSQSPRCFNHGFFIPLEYALPFRTIKNYRDRVALLKNWGLYADVGLMVIPTGAYVNLRIGPVAQQMFPNIRPDEAFLLSENPSCIKDIAEAKRALSKTKGHEKDYWRFYEHLPGGVLQALFAFAYNDPEHRTWQEISNLIKNGLISEEEINGRIKSIFVYRLSNVLHDPHKLCSTAYSLASKKNRGPNKEWDPDQIKNSHLFMTSQDPGPVYDNLRMRFLSALQIAGILCATETRELYKILQSAVWDLENRKRISFN